MKSKNSLKFVYLSLCLSCYHIKSVKNEFFKLENKILTIFFIKKNVYDNYSLFNILFYFIFLKLSWIKLFLVNNFKLNLLFLPFTYQNFVVLRILLQ